MTRDDPIRVLLLTLCCGENEIESCCRSIVSQERVLHEHLVFENLPKAEAHALLYETIMRESERFDLFVKLDADMVFAADDSLARIAAVFREVSELDHLVLGVADWFTDTDIIGLHAFSRRARWQPNPSGLFTDPDPVFPGRKLMIRHPCPVIVHHGPDPSPFQAFFFGVHRAMKACQADLEPNEKQPFGARTNWRTVERVWSHYRESRDVRLGLALWGADLVLQGKLALTAVNRQDASLLEAFRQAHGISPEALEKHLKNGWSRWSVRQLRWFRGMGWPMTSKVLARSVRDGFAFPVRVLRQARQERLVQP